MVRLLTSAIFVIGPLIAFAPASAQMYDPRYPVCMHVYGDLIGERMDCIFTSLAQCAATASGLPATCITNPYYASEGYVTGGRSRPPRPYR